MTVEFPETSRLFLVKWTRFINVSAAYVFTFVFFTSSQHYNQCHTDGCHDDEQNDQSHLNSWTPPGCHAAHQCRRKQIIITQLCSFRSFIFPFTFNYQNVLQYVWKSYYKILTKNEEISNMKTCSCVFLSCRFDKV